MKLVLCTQASAVLLLFLNTTNRADMGIRGHWGIENLLHWTKDVHLKEDDTTLRNTKQVTTLVYLNNMALNLLKTKGYKTNTDTFAKISNKIDELIKLFT